MSEVIMEIKDKLISDIKGAERTIDCLNESINSWLEAIDDAKISIAKKQEEILLYNKLLIALEGETES